MAAASTLPRFTRSLRAFTQLEPPRNLKYNKTDDDSYRVWKEDQLKKEISWADIRKKLDPHIDLKELQSLRSHAKRLSGGDQPDDVVDDACTFLFFLFLNEHRVVSQNQIQQMKSMFGTVTLHAAEKVCTTVKNIVDSLRDDILDELKEELYKIRGKSSVPATICCGFRIDEPYYPQKPWNPDTSRLADLGDIIATGVESVAAREFSMQYEGARGKTVEPQEKRSGKKAVAGKSWLEQQIQTYFGGDRPCGMSTKELCDSIVMMLKSTKKNEELQDELFSLLGFDRFELIQELLERRKDVVLYSIAEESKPSSSTLATSLKRTAGVPSDTSRPSYGCQVVVQSQSEKQLQKQVRKEEKKINKMLEQLDIDLDEEPDMNVTELRLKRQAALRVAAAAPILHKTSHAEVQARPNYPNVYDSQSRAKQAAGFISGVKLMLPEGVIRNDCKGWEEVIIPVSEPVPPGVGEKRRLISELDEIGQMAFDGVTSLNRIQSIVFEAAYRTNENLLICAPTGAGKTNIAMLTVVHQIRQHIEKGVILRDQFKVVYIAPMKALAAEMAANFGRKLKPLGVTVRELTGDMQLTKTEIMQTQMLVTTPEKWDVVTRKSTGDVALSNLVKLLIIDEVHLLHGDRGPVVEALVARTLRQVESSQKMIRIVGLSATLPNYVDVARFLRVNLFTGLFYFDSRFRPVPLSQTFIGVKAIKSLQQMQDMDTVCYDKVVDMVQKGHQVMVFVHARNATVRTATVLKEMAMRNGHLKSFEPPESGAFGNARNAMSKVRNKQLAELFPYGFSVHHAGMLRSERSMVEKYFSDGLIKVLVCTSTLAWGVNLPAHAVIIRGTEIYDAQHGSFVDLSILDVLQIFGRAGRPQFDKSGTGIILTTHDKLSHYLSLLTNQFPIESNFDKFLTDNLNAEITLGTISNVEEAVQWLSYSYLYVRMRINPQYYGISIADVVEEPTLEVKRRDLIINAAKSLDKAQMIRFDERTGLMAATDLGRTASHFYVKYHTVEVFNEMIRPTMTEADALAMISHSQEFEQLKVRDDELEELDELTYLYCHVKVIGGSENLHGKVNILLQTYLSRGRLKSFSLISDQSYITQNAVRITRALFEIELRQGNAFMSGLFLKLSKMFELQMWDFECPLKQFSIIGPEVIQKLEGAKLSVDTLREMSSNDIGNFLRHVRMGNIVKQCALEFPLLEMSASLQPITRTVLRIKLKIKADFKWNDRVHGKTSENFWIWIEDPDSNHMYHSEYFLLTKKQVILKEEQELVMTIPLAIDPLPPQYYVRASSDRWIGSHTYLALSFQHLILPENHPPHTDLLDLQPLPISALENTQYEMLYSFTHLNSIQTQIFHCLYHTDHNVLLGAPTGSGKTIAAEIAMFRVFREYPKSKVVYIAPLKALVRERIDDWKIRLEAKLGRKVVELTGDVTPDVWAISSADVIVTTPEKWDGISRSWQTRNYVKDVALIIIDEIHLLGEDRGPVLEVIVSRTNFISSHTSRNLRVVGLSTALANARDLANWLGIGQVGLYNFRPAVRPVPLEVHITGFPGKHYCPRMATMNRPIFQAIRQHSPALPVLVFVSSRRQTRLTALDLIAYLAGEDDQKQWLHTNEAEMDQIITGIKDQNLKLTLSFGIAIHHAGLQERDRRTVEELFVNRKIQVLIATATLAWGVNFPAHMVIVKGTEYYDGRLHRYVDMPITDVLQMMGRAGRPQHDDTGVAFVMVHDVKKNFYKKFLYEPFPVESSLLGVLPDHINAEIVAGTIRTRQDAIDYLTWTYFFRRLLKNPTYYGLESTEPNDVNRYLSQLIEKALIELSNAGCIRVEEDERTLCTTSMGRIASYYYLCHQTMTHFTSSLNHSLANDEVLKALCDAHEYDQLPVRHNEDLLNAELAKDLPNAVDPLTMDSPHTKAHLLLQAHFCRALLPCADYLTDLKSVLDQSMRILQAMMDCCGEQGWLATTLRIQQLVQQIIQARWAHESALLTLPHIEPHHLYLFNKRRKENPDGYDVTTLPGLKEECARNYEKLATILRAELDDGEIAQVHEVLCEMPALTVRTYIRGLLCDDGNADNIEREVPIPMGQRSSQWIPVYADTEYTLVVSLARLNRQKENKIHAPKFPRPKTEGWFLTLGTIEDGELLALKRIGSAKGSRSNHQLTFYTPARLGRVILTLYVVSDSYIGLDQQYDIRLDVRPFPENKSMDNFLDDPPKEYTLF